MTLAPGVIGDVVDRLGYLVGDARLPVPDWAAWLIKLGAYFGARSQSRPPINALLAVPTRDFAACFAAMGVVIQRALDPDHSLSVPQHFLRLASSLPGTAVNLQVGGRGIEGVLDGIADLGGDRGRVVRVRVTNRDGGNEARLVPEHQCFRVQLADEEHGLGEKRKSHRAKGLTPFLAECLGATTAVHLIERARTDCVVYGTLALLKSELTEQEFSTGSDIRGVLADVVRPKPLVGAGLPHRSCIIRSPLAPTSDGPEAPVVVFDGARAFLSGWKQALRMNTMIVLDRGEPRFGDGLDLGLALLREGGALREPPADLAGMPPGLEVAFFERSP